MTNSIIEQLSELFEIEEWEHENSYFDFKPEPLEHRCSTEDMYPHWQGGRREQLDANSPITKHFTSDDSGIIPISAFEPKETSELRFRPIGNIPFFDSAQYESPKKYAESLQFLFSPISYQNRHALNINLKKNPFLIRLCSTIANRIVYYMSQRQDVEVAAELRTKDDKHSAMLVKFNATPLLIFDRCAGCYKGLPEELLLGWYAPLLTGPNQSKLPNFEEYRTLYEAYHPSSFVLNKANWYIKNG